MFELSLGASGSPVFRWVRNLRLQDALVDCKCIASIPLRTGVREQRISPTKPSPDAFVKTRMKSARVICSLALVATGAVLSHAQSTQGNRLAFDVASVRPNRSDTPPYSNFPLNAGGMYVPNGGLFSATNFPLVTYLFFAYDVVGNKAQFLVPQLPSWAISDRFDIQARAEGNPTKDQMREMMRSLLADRFKLAAHTEKREVPVLALALAKAGKTGPQLQPHAAGTPCQTTAAPPAPGDPIPDTFKQIVAGGLPGLCNAILGLPPSVAGRSRLAGRDVTLGFIADMFSQRVSRGRPMINGTGLTGTFDFLLEFMPDAPAPTPPGVNVAPDPDGLTFEQALRDQLGLKLESRRSALEVLVLDHLERPSEN
jgi:uncharacterized protein (TIGR03435 family)